MVDVGFQGRNAFEETWRVKKACLWNRAHVIS